MDVDPSRGQQGLTFELVDGSGGEGTAGKALFTMDTRFNAGFIATRPGAVLDHEATPQVVLVVRAKDDGYMNGNFETPAFSDRVVTVSIVDVNESPAVTEGQTRTIAENSAPSTAIGAPIVATDPEELALKCSLSAGGSAKSPSGEALFGITEAGQLFVAVPADHEAAGSHLVTVRVEDQGVAVGDAGGGLAAEATVTVIISNVNEAPSLGGGLVLEVSENEGQGVALQPANPLVPAFAPSDPDEGDLDSLVYSITGGSGQTLFVIDEGTGVVRVATDVAGQALDHESVPQFTLEVTVTDSGELSASALATVRVLDANEPPTVEPIAEMAVRERSPVGTVIGTIRFDDPDAGDVLTVEMAGAGDGADFTLDASEALAIAMNPDGRSAKVTVTNPDHAALQFSTTDATLNALQLTVYVTDAGERQASATFVVNVVDNNFPPTVTGPVSALTVAENSDAGTVVGQLTGSDGDGETQSLTFQIVSVNPAAAAGLFEVTGNVDGRTATLKVALGSGLAHAPELNFETFPRVDLAIVARDDGAGQLSSPPRTVVVQLSDVNEAPTVVEGSKLTGVTTTALEDAVPGTQVGNALSALVRDDDLTTGVLTYTLAAAPGSSGSAVLPLAIAASTGQLSIAAGITLDYETQQEYNLVVTASDNGVPPLSVELPVKFTVGNVNEAPRFAGDASTAGLAWRVDEGSAADVGTVGTLVATDVDLADAVRYSLEAVDTDALSVAAASLFVVNEVSGVVSVAPGAALDYESRTSYTLKAVASDNAFLTAVATVTIEVQDVNDLTVAGFNLDGSTTPSTAAIEVPTTGATTVYVVGTNFGPVAGAVGVPTPAVSATYRSRHNSVRYSTTCTIHVPGTVLECPTVAGVGAELVWEVKVGAFSVSSSPHTISYARPTISGINGADALPTAGAASVEITGSGFGPPGTQPTLLYGPAAKPSTRYPSSQCVVRSHTVMDCTTTAGVGSDLQWTATVAGLSSDAFAAGSHAAPFIASVTVTTQEANGAMATSGNEVVTLSGVDLGPADASRNTPVVTYGPTGAEYTATECIVTVAHRTVACRTAPGVGAGHKWVIIVGGIASPLSAQATAYRVPSISTVSGPGAQDAATAGKQMLILSGEQLGPLGSTDVQVTYGGSDSLRYKAEQCTVSAAHSQITCLTAEGTGVKHAVRVVVGGQESLSGTTHVVSYGAPVLVAFSGLGARDALTQGGQTVVIEGRNFGPAAHTRLDAVTYGANATFADVTSLCTVTGHSSIQCETAAGAGRGLKWTVKVDGQQSGSPTTYFAPPAVTNVELTDGSAAQQLWTDGGQGVVITGTNFGPPGEGGEPSAFLDGVTYGVTGTEYVAADCTVVSHTSITCTTVPGVGVDLAWRVVIAGQASALGGATTSYAPPTVTAVLDGDGASVDPATGVIRGDTAGGYEVTLTGYDWGVASMVSGAPGEGVQVTFGGVRIESLAAVEVLPPADGDATLHPRHQLRFVVPEGVTLGEERDVVLTVVDRYQNAQSLASPLKFEYNPPAIARVFKLPGDSLLVEGVSFGGASVSTLTVLPFDPADEGSTPAVVIEGVTAAEWGHGSVSVQYFGNSGRVVIARGDTTSNIVEFSREAAFIANLESTGSGLAPSFYETSGGGILRMQGSNLGEPGNLELTVVTVTTYDESGSVADRPCPIANFTVVPNADPDVDDLHILTCTVPPGQGIDQPVKVVVAGNQSPSRSIDYESPWIEVNTATIPKVVMSHTRALLG